VRRWGRKRKLDGPDVGELSTKEDDTGDEDEENATESTEVKAVDVHTHGA
jgi:hypothetical protein